jgi:uncharacterized protein
MWAWRQAIDGYIGRMKEHLRIDLAELPEDGKWVSGELPKEIFDLPEGDAQAVGPLAYELWVQRYGSELLLTGSLSAPFEFTCVRTLHPFIQTIWLEAAALAIEIGSAGEIDATEALREEVLLNFPVDPRCEDGDVPQKCEIDPRYLAVDKAAEDGLTSAPRVEGDDRWSTLDTFKNLKDSP